MKGIDVNMDGKISYEEFKEWWNKGHKGKLNDLIILKSKSLKACNDLKDIFCYKGINFEVIHPNNFRITKSLNKKTQQSSDFHSETIATRLTHKIQG
jgi:hypothetical protein